ncbi:MAG TPA: tetratricopeptide repeat protein [Gemmataceae bacterium]|nr:tetratricopeptide repeat protein [Gemmataceae bacterium]
MSISRRLWIALCLLAAPVTGEARAQQPVLADHAASYVPLRPQTRQEIARREALELYGLALVRMHQDRLVDAARLLEEARTQDPEASAIHKSLTPVYLALSRTDDALRSCRRSLELDPGDFESWAIYGRQLKNEDKLKEAQNAWVRALACLSMADHPDLRAQLSFDLGALYAQTHDCMQAIAAFGVVIKILDDPEALPEREGYNRAELQEQATDTYERMIKICIEDRQYERALELFAQGRKSHPKLAAHLNYHMAKVELAQGRPDRALVRLESYLAGQPPGTDAYELLISILKELHRSDDTLDLLKTYAERDVHNTALRLLLAREYSSAGRSPEAAGIYSALADESPNEDIYRGLFSLYRKDGILEKALDLFNDAIGRSTERGKESKGAQQAAAKARAMLAALRDDVGLAKDILPAAEQKIKNGENLYGQTLFFMAVLADRARELDRAERFYRTCLGQLGNPRHQRESNNPQQESTVYLGLLDVLWKAHKYEDVVEVCEQGLQHTQATNHLIFYQFLSRALRLLGRGEEAVAAAQKAFEMANEDNRRSARMNYIGALAAAEHFQQALAECQAALKETQDPADVRALRLELSNVYSTMHDIPRSEEQLQLILKSDPNDAIANNNLGYSWADQGKNLEEAERMIRKALELDHEQRVGAIAPSENPTYLDSLAWVLFRRGRLKEASAILEKALQLMEGEEDPAVWDHAGDVYFRMEERERARAAWQKSVTLYETEKLHKADDHYKELKHKLHLLEAPKRHP